VAERTATGWTATGVVAAPLDQVCAAMLAVHEGRVGADNAPLLAAVPGAGPLMRGARLRGGPRDFTLHYGGGPAAGTVEVGPRRFAMQGGFKFRAEYAFSAHPRGTLLTYRAVNVAPASHRDRALVRFQFWLSARLRIGLRGALRRTGRIVGARTYPGI
jgi:hypothetical protein